MQKGWIVAGCIFWILGLILFILGLNLTGDAKGWLTAIGSIVFLIGLGIYGAVWLKKKKETDED